MLRVSSACAKNFFPTSNKTPTEMKKHSSLNIISDVVSQSDTPQRVFWNSDDSVTLNNWCQVISALFWFVFPFHVQGVLFGSDVSLLLSIRRQVKDKRHDGRLYFYFHVFCSPAFSLAGRRVSYTLLVQDWRWRNHTGGVLAASGALGRLRVLERR